MIFNILFILLLVGALVCAVLISVEDFRRRIIPDAYLFPLMLIGISLITFFGFPISMPDAVIGAIFGYVLAAVIGFVFDWFIRKNNADAIPPIGMGDIKLIGVGGLWLGTSGLPVALVVACITGAVWAWVQKQKFIPFAPFFLLGVFLYLIASLFLI
ncbi:MAG: A24 family peptidase [Alphaproteobacteria bacterium]|nr:A24 family peptidase [Alphaproteobacteria bacterium]